MSKALDPNRVIRRRFIAATNVAWPHRLGAIVAVALLPAGALAVDLRVAGVFPNKAVVQVDGGPPQTLSVGQRSKEGVQLLSVEGEVATFDIEGKRVAVRLGTGHMTGSPSPGATAVIYASAQGHFFAEGQINGRTTRFIVDTGATSVTLSTADARRLGLAYQSGRKGVVRTANGNASAYEIKLDTVRLGDITLYGVDAVVMDGEKLPLPLLGMSFLNRVDMKREGGALTLTKRF